MNNNIYINGRFLTQKITGVQRYSFELIKVLSNNDKIDIIVLVPKNSILKENYDFDFSIKKIGYNIGHAWEQFDLPLYLYKKNNPLFISFTNTSPIFYRNKISTIHDLSVYENNDWFSFQFRILYKILLPLIIYTSKNILTVSQFSKNEIIKKFKIDNEKIHVAYNGISFSRKKVEQFKKVKSKANYILYVGSISERKNLNSLLEAFNRLHNTELLLKIVGCSFIHIKSKKIKYNKNVEFLKNVSNDELVELYSNAKLLVFPSFYEGFGIPPLEAMFCECPVIASNIPVIKELYGDSVLYINPFNIDSIKDKIELLLIDDKLRRKIIEKSLKKIKKFSWIKSGAKVLDVIKNNT